MQSISPEQFKKLYGKDVTDKVLSAPNRPKQEPGFFERLKQDVQKAGTGISEAGQRYEAGQQSGLETLAQGAGSVIGGITSAVSEVPIVHEAIGALGSGINAIVSTIPQEKRQQVVDMYNSLSPREKANIEAILNIASVVPAVKGGELIGKAAITGAEKGIDLGKASLEATGAAMKATKEAVAPITESATNIGSRIKTNVGAKRAEMKTISELPTETARNAVRNGIEIQDINSLYSIPKEQQNMISGLLDVAKNYSAGLTKQDPIEIVGKPIVSRIKELETKRQQVGAQLGEVAKNLGVVTKPELENGVFSALKKVNGLDGITVKNGKLDFSNTTLLGKENLADRKALQEAYTQATTWGNGYKAHLYRQSLFETLGGKKASGQMLTDTQEKGLEAIRSGLSNVLETKNPKYKTLSNEYRKIVQPMSQLRKMMKTIDPTASEDILNLQAGLLARRLTSNAPSNPQLRAILQQIDQATKTPGKTRLSTETLMDAYNMINKYYDIAPKTGFQGGVKTGVEQALGKSIPDVIGSMYKSTAGASTEVRQKAFEDALKEAFKK